MVDDILEYLSQLHEREAALANSIELVEASAIAVFAWPVAAERGIGVALELDPEFAGWADLHALCELVAQAVREQVPRAPLAVWLLEAGSLPRSGGLAIDREGCSRGLQDAELRWLARLDGAVFTRGTGALDAAETLPTETAIELARLAAEVLGVVSVGARDDLLTRGADSVACVRLLARVRERWGVSLELRAVFDAPRVNELADRIDAELAAGRGEVFEPLERVSRERSWPLSAAQRRLWLVAQLEAPGPAHHVAGGVRLRGNVNERALAEAVRRLAARHEILRTTIEASGGEVDGVEETAVNVNVDEETGHSSASNRALATLRVWPELAITLEVQAHELARQPTATLAELVRLVAARPFDLERGPLWRVVLTQLGVDDHLLVLSLHHVISDGWSMELAVQELLALYAAEIGVRDVALPALPAQFIDYAAWESAWLSRGRLARQLEFWRSHLAGDDVPLELPSTRSRKGRTSLAGPTVVLELDAQLVSLVGALATELSSSAFAVLLASFQLWLARMTGRDDVRVGVPMLGRHRSEAESLIGCFVNTVVVAVDVDRQIDGRTFAREVSARLREAQAHAEVPFETLVQALAPERRAAHNPLFQVTYNHLLTSQRALVARGSQAGLAVERIAREPAGAPFDLSLETEEDDDGKLRALFVYPEALFEPTTVRVFAESWKRLLQQLTAAPERRVGELAMLAPATLDAWSSPQSPAVPHAPLPAFVHLRVLEHAAQFPDAVALVGAGERWTFARFETCSRALALELLEHGIRPEARVGICVPRGPRMIVAALAVWRAGGAYVPLDPSYPQARLDFIARDSGLSLVLTDSKGADLLTWPECVQQLSIAGALARAPHEVAQLKAAVQPHHENVAYVIYTSGSTGQPKGVAVSYGALAMHCQAVGAIYGTTRHDCALHFASFTFDAAVEQWTMPLAHGARLLISPAEPWTGEEIFEAVQRESVTIVYPPTGHLRLLAQHALTQPNRIALRAVCVGGEAVSREDHALITEALRPTWFVNGYGPTEAVITPLLWCSGTRETPPSSYVPIGRAVGDRRVYVLDSGLQPVAAGVVGEIYIGGAGLARGYHGRAAWTAERFVPDPFASAPGARLYRTGDFGRWLETGDVEYLGRRDDQVKVRGFRIELGEIEAELRSHSEVGDAVVVAWPDRGTHRLVAYAVARDSRADSSQLTAVVREALASRLPAHMLPSAFVWLPELELTAHGKVDRRALPMPAPSAREFVAPRTDIEHTLARIWSELLAAPEVGLDDNFFELGGDSITALQLVGRARASGVSLGAKSVFEHQSLRALATVAQPLTAASVAFATTSQVTLMPIQRALLALELPNPDHFNQAVLLALRRSIAPEVLAAALAAVVERHPALRQAVPSDGLPESHGTDGLLDTGDVFAWHTPASELEAEAIIEVAQASLSLRHGRLVRAVLLRGAPVDRLLLVVHHFAVDGVSWRILLEDLATACDAASAGREPVLLEPTSSSSVFAERLEAWAQTPEVADQLEYWRAQASACAVRGVLHVSDRLAVCERLQTQVNHARSSRLLSEAGRAYRMRPHELLLSALVRAIERWNGQSSVAIQLESHGRESRWSDVDLSRSVGWFTALYPVTLRCESDLGATLRGVKEHLRRVPDGGLGYGVLRELGQPVQRDALRELHSPVITFNYLGQFEDAFDTRRSPFELLSLEPGSSVDPDAWAASPIVIDAWVVGGELTFRWTISPTALSRRDAERLLALFDEQLDVVLEHGATTAPVLTPSDLPHVLLAPADLEALPLDTAAIEQAYPVTPLQHGMLFHAVSEPSSEAYFNQLVFELQGVTPEALEREFHAAVVRHEALRSGFFWQAESAPLRIVLREASLKVTLIDLRTATDLGAARDAARRGERAEHFDLRRPPLSRVLLGRLPNDRVLVVWTNHHLALDGWSSARVLGEVLAGARSRLRAQPVVATHADVLALRARRDTKIDETFWRERVRELDEPTLLATCFDLRANVSLGSDIASVRLDASEYAVLRTSAQSLHVTANTLVQATWMLLLSRFTGAAAVSCGVTVSGRPSELVGSETLVGMYIETLPLIHRVRPEETVAAWLSRLLSENLTLREHDQTALTDIQRWAALPGRALFDSLIVFENYPIDEALRDLDPALAPSQVEVIEETNYAFTLSAQPSGTDLELRLAYPRGLAAHEGVRLLSQFRSLLARIAANPAQQVGEIALLSLEESQQLDRWNATGRELDRFACVPASISERAKAQPNATALVFEGIRKTYAELERHTNQLAHRLRALGVGPDVRVAVVAERSFELVEALVATLKAGGAYVPVDPELPAERIAIILEDIAPRVVLTQRAQVERLQALERETCLVLDELALHGESSEPPSVALHPDNAAYVIYTSGSTGTPKGAANTHRGLFNRLSWMQDAFPLGPNDVVLQKTPYAFDVSVWEFFWPLMTGSTLVIAPPGAHREPERLAAVIEEAGVTTLHFVPSMLHAFVVHTAAEACRSLRRVMCSGEALSLATAQRAAALWPWASIHNLYGPTEASIDVTHWAYTGDAASIPIGRPIWNTAVYVLDVHLERAPIGRTGELYLAGIGLARGYHARPALTAERFVPDPWGQPGSRMYRTGDLARLRADGAVEYLGRTDHQLKLRGFRIEPAEIEAQLRSHTGVRDAVVVARSDGAAPRLVGYVALGSAAARADRLIAELDAELRKVLPEYMVPAQLVALEAFPLTASGKLDRRALPVPGRPARTRIEPATALEAELLGVFREVLHAAESGVEDDFFELGGDSLVSLQLIARARRLGIELSAKQVFEARNVAKLAALVSANGLATGEHDSIPRISRAGWLPLSFAQERLWFLAQLEPDSPAYNISGAIRLRGRIDVARLRAAFDQLVSRHEALRTSFAEQGERGMQRVHASAKVVLREEDVSGAEAESRATELCTREALTPFSLDACPLLRVVLAKLGARDHVLVVSLHHLIADAGSIAMLVDELRAAYDLPDAELEPLPLQYADYAAWQRARLGSGELARQLEYWRAQLGDSQPVMELPVDRPRPAAQSYRGEVVTFSLDATTVAAISRLGRESGATAFMVLLSAFESLLYRLTGQRDLRIGIPVTNRSRVELERIAGVFVNTLVVRTQLDGALTFAQLLSRVKDAALGAQAHRDLPFEQLVEALSPERSLSHNPLFQVMFDHQRGALSGVSRMGDAEIEAFDTQSRATQLDLTVETIEENGTIRGSFTYATDLFDRATIESMAARFVRTVAQLVREPALRLCELELLDAAERTSLSAAALPVRAALSFPERFVHETIAARAREYPAAPALIGEAGPAWTYALLEQRSNQWAQRLRAHGVGPEVRVGLYVGRSPQMVLGALAILKAGGAYVPLDPSYPIERLRAMVAGAALRLLVTERGQLAAAELGAECVWLDADDVSAESTEAPNLSLAGENLAYVVYTSGSTGQPKAVGVTHAALAEHIAAIGADYGMRSSDCALHFASMSFDAGVEQWISPLAHGARLLIRGDELWSAERAVEVLRDHAVSWFEMPPGYLREVADAALATGNTLQLRACSAGGEAVSRESLSVILQAVSPAPVINGYGPTETVITPMTWHATSASECTTAYAPIGRVVGPRAGYVLDADLNLVPAGVTGELYIGGLSVARGYIGRPGWTADRFVPDPHAAESGSRMYRTGDLARWLEDGAVEYVGRADQQVKVRGFRIELGEVEAQLLQRPGVREAVVVAQGGAVASRLIGYVAGDVEPALLRQQLRAALPEYMVPAQLVVLPALPRNANGKVDRRRLPEPQAAVRAYTAPTTELERQLCEIWRDVLAVAQVGVTDNFFDLGGDSIRSLQVISRARKLGIELRPRDLFERQTVAELSSLAARVVEEGARLAPISRAPGRHRLSYAQERLWFLAQLEPESAAYNVAGAVRVRGAFDVAALQTALDRLVERHETLRTTFEAHDGVPFQRIHAGFELRVQVRDLRHESLEAVERLARAHVEAEAHAPFDLERGPLLRVSLVRMSDTDQVLSLAMHHIVADGWSLDIAIEELSARYASAQALPALPVQYVDYAHWQRAWLEGAELTRQLEYWRAQLSTEHAVLALPADRARPQRPTHSGEAVDFALEPALGHKLRELARVHDATPFVLLLAAWQTLLYRLTGQREIRVGVPITNRNRLETERIIGFFVNTQVLRTELDPTLCFVQIIAEARETVLGARENQDLPFERLVELLQPARSLEHNPLFQVMYNHLRRTDALFAQSPELQVEPFEWQSRISQFDLCLDTEESALGALSGRLTYAADLFDRATVESWVQQFVRGLGALLLQPEAPIGALAWLDPKERSALLSAGAQREVVPARDVLHERIRAQAELRRAHTACSYEGERLSYGALELRANQWAHRLRANGVGPNVLVGLCVERSLELVVGILAILKAGGAYLPLDPAAPPDRLAYMLEDSHVSLVLTQAPLEASLPHTAALQVLCLDREDVRSERQTAPANQTRPDHLAYVIYTSGSTGRPKGALLSHANVTRLFDATQRWFGFDAHDVWTLFHSYAFDFSVWELFGALLHGGQVVIVPYDVSRSPNEFHELLVRERVTILNQTPSAFRQLSQVACAALDSDRLALRHVIFGGEALEPESLRAWFERFGDASPQLVNMYGITETTVHVTYRPVSLADLERSGSPIGEPIPDLSLFVLDASLEPCAHGVTGELYVGGAGLAHGYLGRPALTAERFVPNPFGEGRLYRSGDLAVRRRDGSLEYLGRSDHQVKIRGFRIELGEITAHLQSHPLVADAAVIARPGPSGQRLIGYVALRSDVAALETIKADLRRALPEYMVPALVALPELPLTVNGKLDRDRLPDPTQLTAAYVEPGTPVERQVAAIWSELLGVARISNTDDFFALGGHSLLVVQVGTRVQQQLGVTLPLRVLFEAPTLQQFAARIVDASATGSAESQLDVLDALLRDLENES